MLKRAAESVLSQTAAPELLIVDDGSTDDTSDFVRTNLPSARLFRNEMPLGIIAARNRAALDARGDILFTLDDDAIFTSTDTVERTLEAFAHPRVGVAALPLINFIEDRKIPVNCDIVTDDPDFPVLHSYLGGANAIRLDVFHAVGGYAGAGRQNEETTLALKALDAGYVVRLVNVPPVHHFPERSRQYQNTVVWHGSRNRIVFALEMVPFPDCIAHIGGTIANSVRTGVRTRSLGASLVGTLAGLVAGVRPGGIQRNAVRAASYRLSRRILAARGRIRFSEIEKNLPPMISASESDPLHHS